VGGHGAAVILGAFDGAAPTLRVAVTAAESSDPLVVDRDILSVIASSVVKFVFDIVRIISSQ
jgi:hypothetical protein